MPPKNFISSFPASDANNEIDCPLKYKDGASCRKRCNGEKRYRSMQEHIRRAHAENYIAKLPATEESIQLMINTPPSQRPQPPPTTQSNASTAYGHDRDVYSAVAGNSPASATPRTSEDHYPAAATAAVALAQLHDHHIGSDWGSEAGYGSESDGKIPRMQSSVELPPIKNHLDHMRMPPFQSSRRELLPSMLAHSPPSARSSTLPPLQRKDSIKREKPVRPRKSSITQNHRRHERTRSKDQRRLSIEGRKAFSAEPPGTAAMAPRGLRWGALLEAVGSVTSTEADSDRDITPVPQSPPLSKRTSLPPLSSVSHNYPYKSSPLQKIHTPPLSHTLANTLPFPPIETLESSHSTQSSGHNFHIPSSGLSTSSDNTSPTFQTGRIATQVYCAMCRRPSVLGDCFACTECISPFCSDCVYTLSSRQHERRGQPCPFCQISSPRYKAFQLNFV